MIPVTVRGLKRSTVLVGGGLQDRFHLDDCDEGYLAFSDGTVLRIRRSSGGWTFDLRADEFSKMWFFPDSDSDCGVVVPTLPAFLPEHPNDIPIVWCVFGPDFVAASETPQEAV